MVAITDHQAGIVAALIEEAIKAAPKDTPLEEILAAVTPWGATTDEEDEEDARA